ncbi:MAG TPA: 1-acyl-sn-glycerol-3-phosphate acyltransferase [bacterium]|nr:1-acyl-sn-glycerol-3-phosphate acyltransferase [bacterium]
MLIHRGSLQPGMKLEWEKEFSLSTQPWLKDHCPTFTIPTLPFSFMVAEIAQAGRRLSGLPHLIELRDVKVTSWLAFPEGNQRVRVSAEIVEVGEGRALVAVRLASFHRKMGEQEIFSPFCEGRALLAADEVRDEFSALVSEEPALAVLPGSQVYASGYRFSGPSFQIIRELRAHRGNFWTAELALPPETPVDPSLFFPFLLDGLFQSLPKEEWPEWQRSLAGRIGFPFRISSARFFGPEIQDGPFQAEVRFLGFETENQLPQFRLRLFARRQESWKLMAELAYQEYLVPLGKLLELEPSDRAAFLREGRYIPDLSLSEVSAEEARLKPEMIRQVDWLKGTVAQVYLESPELFREYRGLDLREALNWLAERVVAKELVAMNEGVHPRDVHLKRLDDGSWEATSPALPHQAHRVSVEFRDGEFRARKRGPTRIDLDQGLILWRARLGLSRSPVEVLGRSLIEKFLGAIALEDSRDFESLRGRPVLFLVNHQTFVESFLLNLMIAAVAQNPVVFLAKHEHREQWIGRFEEICTTYPGTAELKTIHFVDREDPRALLEVGAALENFLVRAQTSVVIHVEGRRSYEAADQVQKVSSVWLDLSIRTGVPVVPVQIVGGLPATNPERRKYDFPVDYGKQRFVIGRSIPAANLAALPYVDRLRKVKAALNRRLGALVSRPFPAEPEFRARVEAFARLSGASEPAAALWTALERHWFRNKEPRSGLEFDNPFDALIAAGQIMIASGQVPRLETSAVLDSAWFENVVAWLFGGSLKVEVGGQASGYRLKV